MEETSKIREKLLSELRVINPDDPIGVQTEIKSRWEKRTNKKLYPSQSDNFIINELAATDSRRASQVNHAMLQNYVRTASGIFLEELGLFWGVTRLIDTITDEEGNESELLEDDDRLRMRILLAPEAITSAGTVGSYTFHALSADIAIVDVEISTPDDGAGKVHVTVHGDGSVSDEVLADKVYRVMQDEKVKVLCVRYTTSPPIEVHYKIDAEITVYEGFDEEWVKNEVTLAIKAYTESPQRINSIENVNSISELSGRVRKLGIDIVESQVIDVIHDVDGVYKAKLNGFPESGVIKVKAGDDYPDGAEVKIAEIGVCNGINVKVVGHAKE